jgi:hypothetical protein
MSYGNVVQKEQGRTMGAGDSQMALWGSHPVRIFRWWQYSGDADKGRRLCRVLVIVGVCAEMLALVRTLSIPDPEKLSRVSGCVCLLK